MLYYHQCIDRFLILDTFHNHKKFSLPSQKINDAYKQVIYHQIHLISFLILKLQKHVYPLEILLLHIF